MNIYGPRVLGKIFDGGIISEIRDYDAYNCNYYHKFLHFKENYKFDKNDISYQSNDSPEYHLRRMDDVWTNTSIDKWFNFDRPRLCGIKCRHNRNYI